MATPNKKTITNIVRKVTKKLPKLQTVVNKPLITVEVGDSVEIVVDYDHENWSFDFNIKETEHCCGLFEAGGFDQSGYSNSITNAIKTEAIKKALNQMFIENKGKTFFITTIATGDSATMADALRDEQLFTPVKSFKNNGNGNLITVWISNK